MLSYQEFNYTEKLTLHSSFTPLPSTLEGGGDYGRKVVGWTKWPNGRGVGGLWKEGGGMGFSNITLNNSDMSTPNSQARYYFLHTTNIYTTMIWRWHTGKKKKKKKRGGGGREKKKLDYLKWVGFTLSEEIGFPDRLSSWMWMLVLSEWPGHRHIEICYTPALHTWKLRYNAQCTKHNQKETPWKVIRGRLNGQWALMPFATEMHLTDVIWAHTHTQRYH